MNRKVLFLTKGMLRYDAITDCETDAYRTLDEILLTKEDFIVLEIAGMHQDDLVQLGIDWGKAQATDLISWFKGKYEEYILDTSDENWWYQP